MVACLWANFCWSPLQLSSSWPVSLQYQHVKFTSRDPSIPIDGLEGLGVPSNVFPPLLELLVRVFYHPHKGKTLLVILHWLIIVGSLWWLKQHSKFFISCYSCSISFVWAYIFWSFSLPLFWEWVSSSADVPDEVILFMAGLTLGIFIHVPNIEMHSALNWVKFIWLPCVFKMLHAIAAKCGSHNQEANWVLSASFT